MKQITLNVDQETYDKIQKWTSIHESGETTQELIMTLINEELEYMEESE